MPAKSEAVEIEIDGRAVRLSNPGKAMFDGITKLGLVDYYVSVGDAFLRAMRGRPTMLQRFPDGALGDSFFQKRVPANAPDWLLTTVVATPNGTTSDALVLADLAHVAWAINLGCLGFHVWPYHAATPESCDELRIDLDPCPGVDFPMLREAAGHTRTLLDELGVPSFPKTTGNRGVHVYVPIAPGASSIEVRAAAVAVARELARRHPALITDAWWKEERGTRVFVDFNQNAPHKTVFGAWSVRARAGAQVSAPFHWRELDRIHPDDLTVSVVQDRLRDQGDPWEAKPAAAVAVSAFQALIDADVERGLPDAPWPPVYPKMPGEPPRVAPSRARKSPE
jgi:DNA ligase D